MLKLLDQHGMPAGELFYDVRERGKLIERVREKNLIVDNFKQTHAHLLGGDVTNRPITQWGVGTSGTAPAAGNTALTGAFLKNTDVTDYPATNQVRFAFSLATTEANGMAIMEFGLFTTGSVLYARRVRSSALNKAVDITLSGTWTISF